MYLRAAAAALRFGIGFYLLFTALSRVILPGEKSSLVTVLPLLGVSGTDIPWVQLAVTIVLGILGLLVLVGRWLSVTGPLVALLGVTNGVAALVASQTTPGLDPASRLSLLSVGLRDILVLASGALALAALTVSARGRKPAVTWAPERGPTAESAAEPTPGAGQAPRGQAPRREGP